jgi:DNA gyrase subunit A
MKMNKKKIALFPIIYWVFAALLAAYFLLPFFVLVTRSLMSIEEIAQVPAPFIPSKLQFENFVYPLTMKLDEGDKLINVRICNENEDVLLAARSGKCIRFPVTEVRVFVGRNSTGVRGIKLANKDEVVSMSILNHSDATSEERDEYLRISSAMKRIQAERDEGAEVSIADTGVEMSVLNEEKFALMKANEQFILSVTTTGYGKRSSSYEYRVTGRGGQGIANMEMSARNKEIASSFPIEDDNQIMMVTDAGKLIRMPVEDIRIAGRKTQGVILFRTAEGEKVVSVTKLEADDDDEEELTSEEGSEVLGDNIPEFDETEVAVEEPEVVEQDVE